MAAGDRVARVLVVDDDDLNRRLMERLLGLQGVAEVRTEATADGLEAVVADFDPDLVFLDLHLGGRGPDGIEALALLAEADAPGPVRPVVLVTGDLDGAVRQRALEAGAFDVLAKPYEIDTLAGIVRSAATSRRPRWC